MNLIIKIIKIFPPEAAHLIALLSLNLLYKLKILNLFFPKCKAENVQLFGLNFSNRLGTAAGLDKKWRFYRLSWCSRFWFYRSGDSYTFATARQFKTKDL